MYRDNGKNMETTILGFRVPLNSLGACSLLVVQSGQSLSPGLKKGSPQVDRIWGYMGILL